MIKYLGEVCLNNFDPGVGDSLFRYNPERKTNILNTDICVSPTCYCRPQKIKISTRILCYSKGKSGALLPDRKKMPLRKRFHTVLMTYETTLQDGFRPNNDEWDHISSKIA